MKKNDSKQISFAKTPILGQAPRLLLIVFILFLTGCASSSKNSMNDKEQAVLNLQLGARYMEMGMLSVAKEKLEKANQLDSDNAEVHNALAVLNERLKRYDVSRTHFEKAMDLNPDNASIKNNYGRFLCATGSYQEGVVLLKQALAMPLNDRRWFALTNMGLCYLKQGKKNQAEMAFRKALQENTSYSPALLEMQKISYQHRNYLSARAFLERYLAVAKQTSESLWVGLQTERALGDKTQAEQYRQQLLTLFPASKQAQQVRTAVVR